MAHIEVTQAAQLTVGGQVFYKSTVERDGEGNLAWIAGKVVTVGVDRATVERPAKGTRKATRAPMLFRTLRIEGASEPDPFAWYADQAAPTATDSAPTAEGETEGAPAPDASTHEAAVEPEAGRRTSRDSRGRTKVNLLGQPIEVGAQ